MNLDPSVLKQLIEELEADRNASLAKWSVVRDVLEKALEQTPGARTAPLRNETISRPGGTQYSNNVPGFKNDAGGIQSSLYTGEEEDSDSSDDESYFVQEPLPIRSYADADLLDHLANFPWSSYSAVLLTPFLQHVKRMRPSVFDFRKFSALNNGDSSHISVSIHEVSCDGAPLQRISPYDDYTSRGMSFWEALKSLNSNDARIQAVGRIVTLREASPFHYAALHLTMEEHFDMENMYRFLVENTVSKAYTKGYLSGDHRHQRSIVFALKYHTLLGEDRKPLAWQDKSESEVGLPINSCSSVVAISLSGRPSLTIRKNNARHRRVLGHIYDPFAPWHVLSLQCFPDWHSDVDVHETNHHYVNGPHAFFVTLLGEYRDAAKRLELLQNQTRSLAIPYKTAVFDGKLFDQILFDDDNYTYTRRYSWAAQVLSLLNDEIRALISAYEDTITSEVWSGHHKTFFPGTEEVSSRYRNWRKVLGRIRDQFEREIVKLKNLHTVNVEEQQRLNQLRTQLFSGATIREGRQAVEQARLTVEQGRNIRVLTLVSIFFLPLTTITSIFGMTNMPTDVSFKPFVITTIAVCLPVYLIVAILNSQWPWKILRAIATWISMGTPLKLFPSMAKSSGQFFRLAKSRASRDATGPEDQRDGMADPEVPADIISLRNL